MMNLKLKRTYLGEDYTIGKLYIDDKYFCDTIEDTYRDLSKVSKVPGETAIPYGKYEVIVNMSPKFKRMLPRLLNVPHFEGVLIHKGNSAQDSAGCIILGENKVKGKVINSTGYELKLTSLLQDHIKQGSKVYIEII